MLPGWKTVSCRKDSDTEGVRLRELDAGSRVEGKRKASAVQTAGEAAEIADTAGEQNLQKRKKTQNSCFQSQQYGCDKELYLDSSDESLFEFDLLYKETKPKSQHKTDEKPEEIVENAVSNSAHGRVQTKEREHKCQLCDKGFTRSSDLKVHTRIHTGDKPYTCTVSDQGFSHSGNLKSHMRIHTGDKPYACTVCDKGFRQFCHLKSHMRIHTGDKPYTCTVCDKGFSQPGSLKRHTRVHTGEKPFKCRLCNRAFNRQFSLRRHEKDSFDHFRRSEMCNF